VNDRVCGDSEISGGGAVRIISGRFESPATVEKSIWILAFVFALPLPTTPSSGSPASIDVQQQQKQQQLQ
jgi:hypothetical protein